MTALAGARITKPFSAAILDLPGKTETVYHGGIACWDVSTGLVAKSFVSVNLIPIGTYEYPTEQTHVNPAAGLVKVKLFRELNARWFANATAGDAVVAANLGSLGYLLDDQTVANNDATNTRSVAGRIWQLDTVKGVLVEFIFDASAHLGGLDV